MAAGPGAGVEHIARRRGGATLQRGQFLPLSQCLSCAVLCAPVFLGARAMRRQAENVAIAWHIKARAGLGIVSNFGDACLPGTYGIGSAPAACRPVRPLARGVLLGFLWLCRADRYLHGGPAGCTCARAVSVAPQVPPTWHVQEDQGPGVCLWPSMCRTMCCGSCVCPVLGRAAAHASIAFSPFWLPPDLISSAAPRCRVLARRV